MRAVVIGIIGYLATAEAFAPAASSLSLRNQRTTCTPLALKMQNDNEEYRPLIPTADRSMAPDYAKEKTQFERQGLVEAAGATSESLGPAGEFGGLTRREAFGAGGAAGIGLLATIWAVTRNPGYDRNDKSRSAGKVELNKEVLATKEVQAGLADLTANRDRLSTLKSQFAADEQIALTAEVRKFSVVKLRDDLNKLTNSFDEDTQIKTDRIVRAILQDLNELDLAVKVKEGATRSPKRIEATKKWFDRTEADFNEFLSYFQAK